MQNYPFESPEDRICHRNLPDPFKVGLQLDYFYDIVFEVQGTQIPGNSVILKARSEYFRAMLSQNFQESVSKKITVRGIPLKFFICIIQYLYSDKFSFQHSDSNIEFFMSLITFADYFLLPRLVEIASQYAFECLNLQNVLVTLLVSHIHNAT